MNNNNNNICIETDFHKKKKKTFTAQPHSPSTVNITWSPLKVYIRLASTLTEGKHQANAPNIHFQLYLYINPLDKFTLADKSCHSHAMRLMGNVGAFVGVCHSHRFTHTHWDFSHKEGRRHVHHPAWRTWRRPCDLDLSVCVRNHTQITQDHQSSPHTASQSTPNLIYNTDNLTVFWHWIYFRVLIGLWL